MKLHPNPPDYTFNLFQSFLPFLLGNVRGHDMDRGPSNLICRRIFGFSLHGSHLALTYVGGTRGQHI